MQKIKFCVDAQLLHPRLLSDTLSLYLFLARWMHHLLDPQSSSSDVRRIPPANPPITFSALPEYFVEDIADFMLFLSRFSRQTIETTNVKPIIHLLVTFVASPTLLKNPYLRAKLVEVFCGVAQFPTTHGPGCPSLLPVFTRDPYLVSISLT